MARSGDRRMVHGQSLAPNEIAIDNFAFSPKALTVPRGTIVTWINNDDVPHVIVSPQGRFHSSPVLDTNQRYSVTLTDSGAYDYFCSIHTVMTGKVLVR
jgi:plastocyanin